MKSVTSKPTPHEIAAWIITGGALFLVLKVHLLPALLAGLLVHELVHMLAERLSISRLTNQRAKLVAVAVIAVFIIGVTTLAILGISAFVRSDAGSLSMLMQKMAEIIEGTRPMLPDWAAAYIPANTEALKDAIVQWLREHAAEVQLVGTEAVRGMAHTLIGMVVGALIALREVAPDDSPHPLARALTERARRLADAFRRVVFAQMRIAALNATFTWLYLDVALPLMGIHLPLAKTLVAVTFVVGLLPIIGNLISNTVIVIVSLSHSVPVALGSLAFLIVIHKLEYFLNARIIGSQIRARAWELLLAMLAMEASLGLAGVIAAPIYYAYLKAELADRSLV